MSLALPRNKFALGYRHSNEAINKMSLAHKDRIPWNKGIKAWNHGQKWPDEVKERISNGMIVYWKNKNNRKEET